MSAKQLRPPRTRRLAVLSACLLGCLSTIGIAQAGAATPAKILKFYDPPGIATAVGFDESSNTPPPVGSQQILTLRLENVGSQFGKPNRTKVGRVLIDCTIMAVDTEAMRVDGNCLGIAHVPNGYFTFEGPGALGGPKVSYFAVTGGVGPYADDRGQIRVVNNADGSSLATVTLYSP
jgi:hypothetical protein